MIGRNPDAVRRARNLKPGHRATTRGARAIRLRQTTFNQKHIIVMRLKR
jgi:hypothetical protein